MPEVPAFVADYVERRHALPATVRQIVRLAARLVRVRFEVPALIGSKYGAGDEIEFRIDARALRHYTIEALDPATGLCDVLFYLHGAGPGTPWVEALREGASVKLLGPGAGIRLIEACSQHVCLGDESALGLFSGLTRQAPRRCLGAVEVKLINADYPALAGVPLSALPCYERDRCECLMSWLDTAPRFGGDAAFYLAGRAATVAALRKRLVGELGISGRRIRAKAYWADERRGL